MVVKFEREVGRCIKAMEELDGAIARKKDVSQQARSVGGEDTPEALLCR